MTEQQRIALCRKIAVHPSVDEQQFELHYRVDNDRFKLDPNLYRLTYNDVTVHIGVVFGNIAYYRDKDNLWDHNNKRLELSDELRDKADQALIAYNQLLVGND